MCCGRAVVFAISIGWGAQLEKKESKKRISKPTVWTLMRPMTISFCSRTIVWNLTIVASSVTEGACQEACANGNVGGKSRG